MGRFLSINLKTDCEFFCFMVKEISLTGLLNELSEEENERYPEQRLIDVVAYAFYKFGFVIEDYLKTDESRFGAFTLEVTYRPKDEGDSEHYNTSCHVDRQPRKTGDERLFRAVYKHFYNIAYAKRREMVKASEQPASRVWDRIS